MSGWTVDTLRVYHERLITDLRVSFLDLNKETDLRYQQRFDAQTKALDAAFLSSQTAVSAALLAAKEAVAAAEINNQRWREAANEWRAAMTDRERNFATVEALHSLAETVDKIEKKQDQESGNQEGGRTKISDLRATLGMYIAGATLVLGIVIFLSRYLTKT